MNKPALPSKTLYQGKQYRPAHKTDIRETFREFRAELDGPVCPHRAGRAEQDGPDYRQAEESEMAEYEQENRQ